MEPQSRGTTRRYIAISPYHLCNGPFLSEMSLASVHAPIVSEARPSRRDARCSLPSKPLQCVKIDCGEGQGSSQALRVGRHTWCCEVRLRQRAECNTELGPDVHPRG